MARQYQERLSTYHDQWYMVENLRPRLRPVVEVHRQTFGDTPWYVLCHPDANTSFRLTAELYQFTAMMDGTRTVEDIWQLNQAHSEKPLTQGEIINLLGKLNEAELLTADIPLDTNHLLQRRQERRLKKLGSTLSSFLFIRIPLWAPDAFFTRYQAAGSVFFRPGGGVVWLCLLAAALHALVIHWPLFASEARLTLAPANLPWLYVVIFLSKTVHELGHGFACKYYSAREGLHGEVHSLGLMFLLFVPVPYVDVSSSVSLRSRFSRAAIALAGVYAELLLASVATLIWAYSTPGTGLHLLARNCMIMTSVSTVVFNINPLLRFDGYFVFSDLAGFPNLYQRAQAYSLYLLKRYLLGVHQAATVVHSADERWLYPVYALAAFAYRVLITWGIFFILEARLYSLGFALACFLVFFWFGLPLLRGGWWLLTSPELAGQRTRAQARFVLTVGLLAFLLFRVPVEDAALVQGVVESRTLHLIYAEAEGVLSAFADTDTLVEKNATLLASIDNPGIMAELETLRLQQIVAEARMKLAQSTGDDDAAWQHFIELSGLRRQWRMQSDTAARLHMVAPAGGIWVAPKLPRRQGKWISKGDYLGCIYAPEDMRLRMAIDQFDAARIFAEPLQGGVFVVSGRPDLAGGGDFTFTVESKPAPAGRRELFHPSLSQQVGGSTPTSQSADGRLVTEHHIFELRLLPEAGALPWLAPGQRVDARLLFGKQPLGVQWLRRVRQFFRER